MHIACDPILILSIPKSSTGRGKWDGGDGSFGGEASRPEKSQPWAWSGKGCSKGGRYHLPHQVILPGPSLQHLNLLNSCVRILYAAPSSGAWGEHELDYILTLRSEWVYYFWLKLDIVLPILCRSRSNCQKILILVQSSDNSWPRRSEGHWMGW